MEKPVLIKPSLNHNAVSLAGEFAVLSQLALRGFDANLTLGNTKHVDILVSDPNSGKMFKLEVKTHYGNNVSYSTLFGKTIGWVMSEKHEHIISPDLFYCFVNIQKDTKKFLFYIVPSAVVAKYVREEHQYWLKTRGKIGSDNSIRQFRLGLDNSGYNIETPLSSVYEDHWEFK